MLVTPRCAAMMKCFSSDKRGMSKRKEPLSFQAALFGGVGGRRCLDHRIEPRQRTMRGWQSPGCHRCGVLPRGFAVHFTHHLGSASVFVSRVWPLALGTWLRPKSKLFRPFVIRNCVHQFHPSVIPFPPFDCWQELFAHVISRQANRP
jgi:hypothetical protein